MIGGGFFAEKYWLPRNVTWQELPTDMHDLLYPIYLTPPLLLLRILWESFVGVPLGAALGYGSGALVHRQILSHIFGGFAANTRTKRVLEAFWRFSYYSAAFAFGCAVMHDREWLWDVKQCWIGYPLHPIPNTIWWYYMVEQAFYYSLLATACFDTRRSDFWELIVHHIVTIGLLGFSWTINFVRVGTLVLLSHDLADVVLELGKLIRYDRTMTMQTNVCFVIFLISWILTRIGYFPLILIRSAVTEAASLIQPDYNVFDFTQIPYAPRLLVMMLVALLCLHVFWTFIIVRVVVKTLTDGEAADVRSDDEEEGEKTAKNRKKVLRKKKE